MTQNIYKIVCGIFAGSILSLSAVYANNLTQLDIKRSTPSSSTLNITIYTSSPYDDNVAVTKKDDNKYVIIMPNVSGAAGTKPDLSGLQDLVSDIDVKSVQDDGNGYTKVTLTTTKPVTIKTTAKKSSPLTEEQKAYKNLIARSRVNKSVSNTNNNVPATITFETPKAKPVNNLTKDKKDNVKKPLNSAETGTTKQVKNILQNTEKKVKEKTAPNQISKNKNLQTASADKPNKSPTADVTPKDKTSLENVDAIAGKSENLNSKLSLISNILVIFVLLLNLIIGLFFVLRIIKKFLKNSSALKLSFKENLFEQPAEVQTFNDIINNSDLSWQEKYQTYLDNAKTENDVHRVLKHVGHGEYRFINEVKPENHKSLRENEVPTGFSEIPEDECSGSAQLKPQKANKFKSYNKPAQNISPENIPPIKKVKNQDLVSPKVQKLQIVEEDFSKLEASLEKILHQTPDMEQFNITEEVIIKQMEHNFKTPPVFNEADKIAETMSKTKKLKSFENKIALEETQRTLPLPKTRSEIRHTNNIESKHTVLGNSPLHTNPRRLKGTNLSVGDLIAKSNRLLNIPSENVVDKTVETDESYSIITPEEFFDKVEQSVTASPELAGKVADRLGKITIEDDVRKLRELQKAARNPFKDMVILSGYNITENSGFYVIKDREGKTSLISKIDDDITVLKNFGEMSDVKLQVRVDSPNIYMVKANGSRYLVEINNKKTGVLLEL